MPVRAPLLFTPDCERLYRFQVEELADYALFAIDIDGYISTWNTGVAEVLQYDRQEFIGKHISEIFTPEDRATGEWEKELSRASEEGRTADIRWHLCKDGSRVYVDGVMNAMREDDGQLCGFSKVMKNATARHEAEKALRESESFARSIIESSPDCVKVLDLEGRIQLINSAGCVAMEISDLGIYRDRPWLNFWEGEDRAKADAAVEAARQGQQGSFEAFCPTAAGAPKWWDVSVTPILDEQGEPSRLLSISRDITEKRQAGTVLQQSRDELAQFAHVVSHDLQAPLRTMRSYAQLISKRYKGKLDEDADTFLGFMLEGAKNMEELIQGLLRYAEFGVQEEQKTVDLRAVVGAVRNTLAPLIDETGAMITYGELPVVQANLTQVKQVFQNLLGNALNYRSTRQPRIHIAAIAHDNSWAISVTDNGVGIAPEHYERIFQPLKRLHGSEIAGTGLGLAVCKRIVEGNGGKIWVESKVGEGSAFYFTLPLNAK